MRCDTKALRSTDSNVAGSPWLAYLVSGRPRRFVFFPGDPAAVFHPTNNGCAAYFTGVVPASYFIRRRQIFSFFGLFRVSPRLAWPALLCDYCWVVLTAALAVR